LGIPLPGDERENQKKKTSTQGMKPSFTMKGGGEDGISFWRGLEKKGREIQDQGREKSAFPMDEGEGGICHIEKRKSLII